MSSVLIDGPTVSPLKLFRIARGYSQPELGRKSGLPTQRISYLENGLKPNANERKALARALGVKVEQIFPQKEGEA